MTWLQTLDVSLFRFINLTLSNPVLDGVMPFLSGNRLFYPALVVLGIWLLWKGGARARLMAVMLFIILSLGDMFVINLIKQAVARPRPFEVMAEVHVLAGKARSASMPSSHTSSWFAATLIVYGYYRWSWRLLLPLAAMVGLSRIYVGVHYPSDVLAGAILGAGYAAAGLWSLNALWQSFGRDWFPGWWRRMPSLWRPVVQPPVAQDPVAAQIENDRQLLRLGYLLIFAQANAVPRNQFHFWPGYRGRHQGENAIYVREVNDPKLARGWFWKWLTARKDLEIPLPPEPSVPQASVVKEFESISDWGVFEVKYQGRVLRRLQLFACRALR